ncbi:MAG TPA: hypothetical protein VGG99_04490 [Acetobacteraceae bacterium]|jgi:hypothetical protein
MSHDHGAQSIGALATVLGLLVFTTPMAALAAPFCMQTQALPPQCLYYDASECAKDAARQGGLCAPNPAELKISAGIGHYCLLTSDGAASCIYADLGTCTRDAQQQQAACVMAPNSPEAPGADPFREVRPLMAGY